MRRTTGRRPRAPTEWAGEAAARKVHLTVHPCVTIAFAPPAAASRSASSTSMTLTGRSLPAPLRQASRPPPSACPLRRCLARTPSRRCLRPPATPFQPGTASSALVFDSALSRSCLWVRCSDVIRSALTKHASPISCCPADNIACHVYYGGLEVTRVEDPRWQGIRIADNSTWRTSTTFGTTYDSCADATPSSYYAGTLTVGSVTQLAWPVTQPSQLSFAVNMPDPSEGAVMRLFVQVRGRSVPASSTAPYPPPSSVSASVRVVGLRQRRAADREGPCERHGPAPPDGPGGHVRI